MAAPAGPATRYPIAARYPSRASRVGLPSQTRLAGSRVCQLFALRLRASQLVERSAETRGQLRSRAAAPVVEKNHVRLGIQHVMVDRHDVQAVRTQGLQHRVDFSGAHGDVTGDLRVGVIPSKSSPGVQAHAGVDGGAVLFEAKVVATQGEFVDRA